MTSTSSSAERERRERSDFLRYKDADGRVADFHAQRHTYISGIVATGASVKTCQNLASGGETDPPENSSADCHLALNAPHVPDIVERKFAEPYLQTLPEEDRVIGACFYGMIANIDWNLGRLRARLRELGLENDTLLIFTSDNGSRFGRIFNAGMRSSKGSPYEGGHRVPCFLHWPGGALSAGADVDRLLMHFDWLPTLSDLCGLRRAPALPLDGRSFAPLLRDAKALWPPRTVFVEDQNWQRVPEKWRQCAVMTEEWRLINGNELYAIRSDPAQKTDVAAQHPQVVEELRRGYDTWWSDVTARVPEYPPIFLGLRPGAETDLRAVEWHEGGKLADLPAVWTSPGITGWWRVQIVEGGNYRFELRRWPVETDRPITADAPAHAPETHLFIPTRGKRFPPGKGQPKAVAARVRIQGLEQTVPVTAETKAAALTLPLQPGLAELRADFLDAKGQVVSSAYFVLARHEGDGGATSKPLSRQKPTP